MVGKLICLLQHLPEPMDRQSGKVAIVCRILYEPSRWLSAAEVIDFFMCVFLNPNWTPKCSIFAIELVMLVRHSIPMYHQFL